MKTYPKTCSGFILHLVATHKILFVKEHFIASYCTVFRSRIQTVPQKTNALPLWCLCFFFFQPRLHVIRAQVATGMYWWRFRERRFRGFQLSQFTMHLVLVETSAWGINPALHEANFIVFFKEPRDVTFRSRIKILLFIQIFSNFASGFVRIYLCIVMCWMNYACFSDHKSKNTGAQV